MHNDRFKIRYYSKELKRYLKDSEIQAIFVMNCVTQKADDNAPEQAVNVSLSGDDESRYATEQCTGICDRNGKLIYENDDVSTRTISGKHGTVVWTDDCCFRIHCSDGDFLNIKMIDVVIGNHHDSTENNNAF